MSNTESTSLTDKILATLRESLHNTPPEQLIHVVLTGGSTGSALKDRLGEFAASIHAGIWERVHLWWGDERFVPSDSSERNDFRIEETLGKYFSSDRVHRVIARDQCVDAQTAADLYAVELERFGDPIPRFTCVMLGLGPDGHIASIFPNSDVISSSKVCSPVFLAPKPPPTRITMTLNTLNSSDLTLIFAAGPSKSSALSRLLAKDGTVQSNPARGIRANRIVIFD